MPLHFTLKVWLTVSLLCHLWACGDIRGPQQKKTKESEGSVIELNLHEPDISRSSVVVKPQRGVKPNGADKVLVEISLVNVLGQPLAAQLPQVLVSGEENVLSGLSPTDTEGKTQFWLSSYQEGEKRISVQVQYGNRTLLLQQQPQVHFGPLFKATKHWPITQGGKTHNVAVGDVNKDGHLDLVGSLESLGQEGIVVWTLLGDSSGQFSLPLYDENTSTVMSPSAGLALGHFDGDEFLDVLFSYPRFIGLGKGQGNGNFLWYLNEPKQNFGSLVEVEKIEVGDINSDGRVDFAAATASGIFVYINDGEGSFVKTPAIWVPEGASFSWYRMALQDLDGDGNLDLVAVEHESKTLDVYWGFGNGSFTQTPVKLQAKEEVCDVELGALDGSDLKAVVTANCGTKYKTGSTVSVWRQSAKRVFLARTDFDTATRPNALALADFNGDGLLDIASSNGDTFGNQGGNTVNVLLQDQVQAFHDLRQFTVGSLPVVIKASDLNKDGKNDLVVANYNGQSVSVLMAP